MTSSKKVVEGKDKKTFDGKNAYDVLRSCPDCPIQLPKATSMTQARMDYEYLEDSIIQWYNTLNKSFVNP